MKPTPIQLLGTPITRNQLERGIWNAIRKQCVLAGFLPDRRLYNTEEEFDTAIEALRSVTPGNYIFDVRGVGSNRDRDGFRQNTFYLNEGDNFPGTVGNYKLFFERYTDEKGFLKYKKSRGADRTYDVEYEVEFSGSDVQAERLMRGILENAIDQRDYIHGLNDDFTETEKDFFIEKTNEIDLNSEKIFERKHTFVARDLILRDYKVIDATVPPVHEITAIIDESSVDGYTGLEFTQGRGWVVLVTVNEEGDLVYDNTFDPSLSLSLVDGELVVSGPNKNKYSIDEDGNLIYNPLS